MRARGVNKTAKISREIGISPIIQRLDECSRWTATIFDGDATRKESETNNPATSWR